MNVYDALFADIEGSQKYARTIRMLFSRQKTLMDLGCGTGDLLALLSDQYEVFGIDLDAKKIEHAKKKYPQYKERFMVGDFLDQSWTHQRYDGVYVVNDTLNYLLTPEDLEKAIKNMSLVSDELFLDSHHPYRLEEFSETYLEEGRVDGFDYGFQIEVEGEFLFHTINYFNGHFDMMKQWVFKPSLLIDLLEREGYQVYTWTDFEVEEIAKEGEKVMYYAKR